MRPVPTIGLSLTLGLAGISLFASAQSAPPQISPMQTQSAQQLPATGTEADAGLPVYDVSVIRPSAASENGDRYLRTQLNVLNVKNMALIYLLETAFDVPEDMIIGLPEWAKHARLDIEAKTLEPDIARLRKLTMAQRRAMMQALFEDRLGLKWHYETRVFRTYDLLVVNAGPKLTPTEVKGNNSRTSVNDTRFKLTNIPISELAVVLSDKLGRPVVDKTGLTGRYDISLEWSPDLATQADSSDVPPLFTAMREKLGLKLEGGKDPVQVFVIDRLTAPEAN